MPYIKQKARDSLEPEFSDFIMKFNELCDNTDQPSNAMFNYVVFRLLRQTEREDERMSYTKMSSAMAGVNDAVEEFRRRFLNPLEDVIRESRGDVV